MADPDSPNTHRWSLSPRQERPELRDVDLRAMGAILRASLGFAPDASLPGERAAWYRRPIPEIVRDVDVGAWLAWTFAGLPLFAGGLPKARRALLESRRVLLALAMFRSGGNITRAGRAMEVSRKVLRDNMRRLGLYPWTMPDDAVASDRSAR